MTSNFMFYDCALQYEKANATFNNRNSYSKTDEDATFMRMKEDHMLNGQLKPEVLTTIMD